MPCIQPLICKSFNLASIQHSTTLNSRYDAFAIHLQNQKLIAEVRIYKQVYNIKIYWLNSILQYFCNSHNHICYCKHLLSESIHNIFSGNLISSICRTSMTSFSLYQYNSLYLGILSTNKRIHMLDHWHSNHST